MEFKKKMINKKVLKSCTGLLLSYLYHLSHRNISTYVIMEVTEAYLNQTYEVFATEQMKLIQGLKATDDEEKQKKVQKEFSAINQIMIQILRFRNLKNQR